MLLIILFLLLLFVALYVFFVNLCATIQNFLNAFPKSFCCLVPAKFPALNKAFFIKFSRSLVSEIIFFMADVIVSGFGWINV